MPALQFDNSFLRDLPGDPDIENRRRQVLGAAYSRVAPTPVAAPRLIAHSREVAALLDLDEEWIRTPQFAQVYAGNDLLPGMEPYAANYGGHQFGAWAGQLGDGRAISLGEVVNANGERWELQLKGAGPTPYARTADGRAVLRSSVREFLCSEAMHHLGVPTTRALCLIGTGEEVVRDMFYDGNPHPEPGAIVCRVSPSFIRFGTFELPASRGDHALLESLVDFTIRRDFPHLRDDEPQAARAKWFNEVCERTARLIAEWTRVGFVHGVMNTDNMSILGLTIDYGPYGWVDNFDRDWTPNTTDAEGRRYRFGHQPQVAQWNLVRLANAVAPVFAAHDALYAGLERYIEVYTETNRALVAAKFGFEACLDDDLQLMAALHDLLEAAEMDMTIFFRTLADFDAAAPTPTLFAESFYDATKRVANAEKLSEWLARYADRLRGESRPATARRKAMNQVNPRYVLRNYLAQQVIERAEQGDDSGIHELLDVLRHPYDDQPGREQYAQRRPDWARNKAGCSMLSCSS